MNSIDQPLAISLRNAKQPSYDTHIILLGFIVLYTDGRLEYQNCVKSPVLAPCSLMRRGEGHHKESADMECMTLPRRVTFCAVESHTDRSVIEGAVTYTEGCVWGLNMAC